MFDGAKVLLFFDICKYFRKKRAQACVCEIFFVSLQRFLKSHIRKAKI